MWSDFSPCSFTTRDGQQLSTQPVDSETTVSLLAQDAHPEAAACSLTPLSTCVTSSELAARTAEDLLGLNSI